MRISHDKESGALYIKLRSGQYDHTEDFSERADVYVDVDADGNILGLEALSFNDLAQAIEEHGGKLDVPESSGASTEVVDHPMGQEASSAAESTAREASSATDQVVDGEYTLEYDEDEAHTDEVRFVGDFKSRRSR